MLMPKCWLFNKPHMEWCLLGVHELELISAGLLWWTRWHLGVRTCFGVRPNFKCSFETFHFGLIVPVIGSSSHHRRTWLFGPKHVKGSGGVGISDWGIVVCYTKSCDLFCNLLFLLVAACHRGHQDSPVRGIVFLGIHHIIIFNVLDINYKSSLYKKYI